MTGGVATTDVVKRKIKDLQSQLETLELEILDEDAAIKVETDLRDKAEAEVAAMTRRIRLLEEDLEVSSSRLVETLAKLEEASKTAEESERAWREVQYKLDTYDTKVEQLKKTVKDAEEAAKEADQKHMELSNTLQLTERNLALAQNRITHAEATVNELENDLKILARNWKSMEIKHEQSLEVEKDLEMRITALTHHVKEAESRACSIDSEINRRVFDIKKTKERIAVECKMYETLRKEMDTMIDEFHSI